MEQDDMRLDRLKTQIADQIDFIAKLICGDQSAFEAVQLLENLTKELGQREPAAVVRAAMICTRDNMLSRDVSKMLRARCY